VTVTRRVGGGSGVKSLCVARGCCMIPCSLRSLYVRSLEAKHARKCSRRQLARTASATPPSCYQTNGQTAPRNRPARRIAGWTDTSDVAADRRMARTHFPSKSKKKARGKPSSLPNKTNCGCGPRARSHCPLLQNWPARRTGASDRSSRRPELNIGSLGGGQNGVPGPRPSRIKRRARRSWRHWTARPPGETGRSARARAASSSVSQPRTTHGVFHSRHPPSLGGTAR
jgi:hypothetical protein